MLVNSPEQGDEGSCDADETEEGFCEFVVACGNAAEVLQPRKEVFDAVPAAISFPTKAGRVLAFGARRNASLRAASGEPLAEGIAVVAFVCDDPCCWLRRHHGLRLRDVGFLPRAQHEADRAPARIDQGVKFCIEATTRAAHGLITLASRRIGGAAMHLDVGAVQVTRRAADHRSKLRERLRPHALPAPPAEVLVDAVPVRVGLVDRPPLTTLTQDHEDRADHHFQFQRTTPPLLSPSFSTPPGTLAFRCLWN